MLHFSINWIILVYQFTDKCFLVVVVVNEIAMSIEEEKCLFQSFFRQETSLNVLRCIHPMAYWTKSIIESVISNPGNQSNCASFRFINKPLVGLYLVHNGDGVFQEQTGQYTNFKSLPVSILDTVYSKKKDNQHHH